MRLSHNTWKANLAPEEFVTAVMKGLTTDLPEIGYGTSAGALQASRAGLDQRFEQMNSRW